MTEQEYKAREEEFDKLYEVIDAALTELGFGEYNDGSGDYGTRRLYKDNKLVHEITINDMVDIGRGEYPDHMFFHRASDTVIDSLGTLYHVVLDILNFLKDSNYYTPTIDEFHSGFEYQQGRKREHGLDWIAKTFTVDCLVVEGSRDRTWKEENLIYKRVKYLDKVDIESLGWRKHFTPTHVACDGPDRIEYRIYIDTSDSDKLKHTNYELCYNKKHKNWTIWHFKKVDYLRFKNQLIVSSINLKNKSELKRLMRQLNIS